MRASALWRLTRGPARHEARLLSTSAALTVLAILASLALPWPLALAVDYALEGRPLPAFLGDLSPVWLLGLAGLSLVLLTTVSGLLEAAAVAVGERAAERIGASLRGAAFDRTVHLSLRWQSTVKRGELVSRISSDTSRVVDAVVATTNTLAPEVLALLAVLVVLLVIDPVLALVGLAVLPMLALVVVGQRRAVRQAQREARTAYGELVSTTTDLVRHVPVIQAFGRTDVATDRFADANDRQLAADLRVVRTEALWLPRADVVLSYGTGLVLILGGLSVLSGEQTLGHLLVVVAYLKELYAPVRGLARLSTVLARAGVSADRLAEILEADQLVPERPDAIDVNAAGAGLVMDEVSFGYRPGLPVLTDLSFEVAPGSTVCLTGPNGTGKSTIVALLLRLYDVDGGSVRLGGHDVRDLTLRSLRSQVGYVPQDAWLLDATVAENIRLGCPTASRSDLTWAAREAGVMEFVEQLPQGLDTPLGEGGATLSGGQRRRLSLARALVRRAPLLLLDEPTASLDDEAVELVLAAIRRASATRTTLIVTHDDRLLPLADQIVRLTGSTVVPFTRPVPADITRLAERR